MAKLHVFCLALDGGQDVEHSVGINVESHWFLDHLRVELQREYAHYREAPRSEIKVWVLERYLDEGALCAFDPTTATTYNGVPIKKIEADARMPIFSYFPNKFEGNNNRRIHLISKLGQISPSNSAQYGLSNVLSSPNDHRARHSTDTQSMPFQLLTAFHDAHWGIPLEPTLTTLPMHMDLDDLSSDILPSEPFLMNALGTTILVRVEYLQVFDMVKKVYDESHHTHLAVVTGQPGIGVTSSAVWFCD
ncbi:hypothetical protein JB92DRAFT_3121213 [Gautieria morchelliformis]|nr:hypothetical protein JB92DRAFT_3121213 [Gautieria morchelliformis]